MTVTVDLGMPGRSGTAGRRASRTARTRPRRPSDGGVRWLMSSDVCKHCTHAACLDVCPTGCAVPHRVRHRRRPARRLQRLRLLRAGLPVRRHRPCARRTAGSSSARSATTGSRRARRPACAQACPTESIQFGELDELRERADRRAGRAAREGRRRRPALRPRPRGRRRRRRRVLPAARRARGLRPAARPGRHDPRPRRRSGSTSARPPSPLAGLGVAVVRSGGADEPARRALAWCPDAGVRVLLRPADPQDADLEDARRPALPLPGRRWPGPRPSSPRVPR